MSSESDTCEKQNGILRNLIVASIAELFFFLLACKEDDNETKDEFLLRKHLLQFQNLWPILPIVIF